MLFARAQHLDTVVAIVVVAVLVVIIAGLVVAMASNKKILCWAEKFATFEGTSFTNPAYQRDGAGGAGQEDGELYVHDSHMRLAAKISMKAKMAPMHQCRAQCFRRIQDARALKSQHTPKHLTLPMAVANRASPCILRNLSRAPCPNTGIRTWHLPQVSFYQANYFEVVY